MTALLVAETAVLVVLSVLVVGLLRSHATILRRLHALDGGDEAEATPAGGPAPFKVREGVPSPRDGDADFPEAADIVGQGLDEDLVSIRVRGTQRPLLLAFLSSSCMTCRPFWDAFAEPATLGLPTGARAVVVARSLEEESATRLEELAAGVPTVVLSSQAWDDYAVPGSPYFVWVEGGVVVGEGTGMSWEQVRRLLVDATAARSPGADVAGAPSDPSRRRGPAMEARIDAELEAAGVRPGDPSLTPGSGEDRR